MSRKENHSDSQKAVMPDLKYNDPFVTKTINMIMKNGEKSIAAKIFYSAIDDVSIETFNQAVNNVSPSLEVKPKRVGGATYQVPIEVKSYRGKIIAIKWILAAAKARSGKNFANKFAAELKDASQRRGGAMKKREDTHRMAEANKAYSHIKI